MALLANGGILPALPNSQDPKAISPRRKGVRQGLILFLTGILLVPILGLLSNFSNSSFLELLTAIAAILCFVGGPLRMLYAAVFEEPAPNWQRSIPPYVHAPMPLHQKPPVRSALPSPVHQPTGWSQRPNTGELVRPPSVTEGTTRLLDKDDPTNR